jgi:hypothetical protein
MQTATKPQIAKIHVLLNNLGITEQKIEIVYNLTNGRAESTKELTIEEARRLIINLAEYDPSERQKSLIFSLAYQAGIIYGSTADDKKMNAAKLNMFLKERGAVKKKLNAMNYADLIKVHRQFEAMVRSVKLSTEKKQFEKELKYLLDEFIISVK